ncbi:hypothetical protein [Deinococcus sp. PESE-13]
MREVIATSPYRRPPRYPLKTVRTIDHSASQLSKSVRKNSLMIQIIFQSGISGMKNGA